MNIHLITIQSGWSCVKMCQGHLMLTNFLALLQKIGWPMHNKICQFRLFWWLANMLLLLKQEKVDTRTKRTEKARWFWCLATLAGNNRRMVEERSGEEEEREKRIGGYACPSPLLHCLHLWEREISARRGVRERSQAHVTACDDLFLFLWYIQKLKQLTHYLLQIWYFNF